MNGYTFRGSYSTMDLRIYPFLKRTKSVLFVKVMETQGIVLNILKQQILYNSKIVSENNVNVKGEYVTTTDNASVL